MADQELEEVFSLFSSTSLSLPQWDGAVRMWEHRQTHPLEEERERERDWQQGKD